jgi:hypothetical protein
MTCISLASSSLVSSPSIKQRLDSFQEKLARDILSAVVSPAKELKQRYARTGVSEVGWLGRESHQLPVDDGTAQFMSILSVLEDRAAQRAANRGWFENVLRWLGEMASGAALVGGVGDDTVLTLFSQQIFGRIDLGEKRNERRKGLGLCVDSTAELEPFVFLLVPGLLSQYSPPVYWLEALVRLRDELGLSCRFVAMDSEAGEKFMIIGHIVGALCLMVMMLIVLSQNNISS